jgi:hypothetical protein
LLFSVVTFNGIEELFSISFLKYGFSVFSVVMLPDVLMYSTTLGFAVLSVFEAELFFVFTDFFSFSTVCAFE